LPKIEEFAQQDLLMSMQLASGEGEITPLDSEDEELIRKEAYETEAETSNQDPPKET
jgi:hypothetical protein